jgi:hypothetical protein
MPRTRAAASTTAAPSILTYATFTAIARRGGFYHDNTNSQKSQNTTSYDHFHGASSCLRIASLRMPMTRYDLGDNVPLPIAQRNGPIAPLRTAMSRIRPSRKGVENSTLPVEK